MKKLRLTIIFVLIQVLISGSLLGQYKQHVKRNKLRRNLNTIPPKVSVNFGTTSIFLQGKHANLFENNYIIPTINFDLDIVNIKLFNIYLAIGEAVVKNDFYLEEQQWTENKKANICSFGWFSGYSIYQKNFTITPFLGYSIYSYSAKDSLPVTELMNHSISIGTRVDYNFGKTRKYRKEPSNNFYLSSSIYYAYVLPKENVTGGVLNVSLAFGIRFIDPQFETNGCSSSLLGDILFSLFCL